MDASPHSLSQLLADAILARDFTLVQKRVGQGASLTETDPYGFTPIIEAAIADHLEIVMYILKQTAGAQSPEALGAALHWALDNQNMQITAQLLKAGASPNFYDVNDGRPVLAEALAKNQQIAVDLLAQHGAVLPFARDYLLTKLIGHRFELSGRGEIVSPTNTMVEVPFEGFSPDITLGLIRDSLSAYIKHFVAREARLYQPYFDLIIQLMDWASRARRLKHYNATLNARAVEAQEYSEKDIWILPVTTQGHAFTLVRCKQYFAICDRRQDTAAQGKVILGTIAFPERLTASYLQQLLYQSRDFRFYEVDLPARLGFVPKLVLPTHSQLAGNCSWANVEITVLVLLCGLFAIDGKSALEDCRERALGLYQSWAQWDKQNALDEAMYQFDTLSKARQSCRVSLLSAVLFQRLNPDIPEDLKQAQQMLPMLTHPDYQDILGAYVKTYMNLNERAAYPTFSKMLKKLGVTLAF